MQRIAIPSAARLHGPRRALRLILHGGVLLTAIGGAACATAGAASERGATTAAVAVPPAESR